jgi:hypothetical protein
MVVLMCSVVHCHLREAKESGSQSSGEQIQVKVERPEEWTLGLPPSEPAAPTSTAMELATNRCWTGIKRVLGGYSVWSGLELSVLVFWLGYVKTESEIGSDFWNPVPDPKPATFYELKFEHETVKT